MASAIHLPKVDMTMEEGILSRWLAEDGAAVKRGQAIFEMETEKVQMEVEADGDGVLRQLVPADTTLKPGDVIGAILGRRAAGHGGGGRVSGGSAASGDALPATPTRLQPWSRVGAISPIARLPSRVALETLTGSGPDGRIRSRTQRAIEAKAATASQTPSGTRGARFADCAAAAVRTSRPLTLGQRTRRPHRRARRQRGDRGNALPSKRRHACCLK
jgi:pyruvate dehydrogenase E2 component (dihydrolipoamide acetyltransferase)